MTKMTFDEYDDFVERLVNGHYSNEGYYPSKEELDEKTNKEYDKYIDFLIFLAETNPEPETDEEIESMTYINKILRKYLILE